MAANVTRAVILSIFCFAESVRVDSSRDSAEVELAHEAPAQEIDVRKAQVLRDTVLQALSNKHLGEMNVIGDDSNKVFESDTHFLKEQKMKRKTYRVEYQVHLPGSFQGVRQTFGISDDELREEVASGLKPMGGGGGKSGADMFLTNRSGSFILKSVMQIPFILEEESFLEDSFMKKYANFVEFVEGDTLLCKFAMHLTFSYRRVYRQWYSLKTLKRHRNHGPFHFIVMASALPKALAPMKAEEYDLKGSWNGRIGDVGGTLKDQDFFADPKLSFSLARQFPVVGPTHATDVLVKAAVRDVAFLLSMNVFDYSMMLFTFEGTKEVADALFSLSHVRGASGDHQGRASFATMVIGDLFTQYTFSMQLKAQHPTLGGEFGSATDPETYALRFLVAMARGVLLGGSLAEGSTPPSDRFSPDVIKSPTARYSDVLENGELKQELGRLVDLMQLPSLNKKDENKKRADADVSRVVQILKQVPS